MMCEEKKCQKPAEKEANEKIRHKNSFSIHLLPSNTNSTSNLGGSNGNIKTIKKRQNMKKYEIIEAMLPFTDEIEIAVTGSKGIQLGIKHINYGIIRKTGEGIVTIVPTGFHLPELPKDIHWVRIS